MIASKTPRSDEAWHEARHGEDPDALYKEAQKMEQELAIWTDNAKTYDAARMKAEKERDEARTENDILRAMLPKLGKPCTHCGLTEISKCALGFPGCHQADDLMAGEDAAFKALVKRLREVVKWNATPPVKHRGKWSLLLQDGIEEFNNLTKTEAQALRQAARRMCIKVATRKTQDQGWTAVVTSRPLRMETQPLPLSENLTPKTP